MPGVGKSSVVSLVINTLGLSQDEVKYVAFTGKAAQVLQEKGLNATTIHRLIYKSYLNKKTGKYYYSLREKEEVQAKVLVVDEVSLVSEQLLRDLASFGIHMILLGDPFQAESIGGRDNGMLKNPHVFLDEVMRQAKDNPIIALSMYVREHWKLPENYENNNNVRIIKRSELTLDELAQTNQIVCGTNKMREFLNSKVREHLGYEGMPQIGDKMIFLKNDWETMNEDEFPIINGLIGYVDKVKQGHDKFNNDIPVKKNCSGYIIDFKPEFSDTLFYNVNLDPNVLRGMKSVLQTQIEDPNILKPEDSVFQEATFGYAITVHKSQGSSYKNMILIVERFKNMSQESFARLLYTGITRAVDSITIVVE